MCAPLNVDDQLHDETEFPSNMRLKLADFAGS